MVPHHSPQQRVCDLGVEREQLVAGDPVAFVVVADGYVEGGFGRGGEGEEHESEEGVVHVFHPFCWPQPGQLSTVNMAVQLSWRTMR